MSNLVKKLVFVVLVVCGLFGMVGCGANYHDSPNPIGSTRTGEVAPVTSPGGRIEHHVIKVGQQLGYAQAWFIVACLIAGVPLLIIFLIPGIFFGRAEQPVEGALIVGFGVLAITTLRAPDLGLTWAVILCNIIPGALLFLKGLVSEEEEGKIAIVAIPNILMIGFLIIKAIGGLINGLLEAPWATMGLILLTMFIFGGAVSRAAK